MRHCQQRVHDIAVLFLSLLTAITFYWHFLYDCDAFLCNVFLMFLVHNFIKDSIVKSVFRSRLDAVKDVRLSFERC